MLWLVWTVGCNETPVELSLPDTPDEPTDPALATEAWPPAAPEEGLGEQIRVSGKKLQPGEEIEMCFYVNIGNPDTVWVTDMELVAAPGLHHSIISRIGTERPASSSECFGFPSDLG